MSDIINGSGYPVFNILDKNNNLIEKIELPLCMEDGLIEDYEMDKTQHKNIYGKLLEPDKDVLYRIYFTLDYKSYIGTTGMNKIDRLYFYFENNFNDYRINFIPRNKSTERNYDVVADNTFQLGINKRDAGHRLLQIKFMTKELVKRNWIDTDKIPSYLNLGFGKLL